MTVRIRLFAGLRERAGWSERHLDLATEARSPAEVWRLLAAELGEAPQLPPDIRVAVNQQFASADALLQEGDELAFLPPISGG
ncbi:MAG: hypothetical protein RLZZ589_1203 [Cyanobacteriota bacterium]